MTSSDSLFPSLSVGSTITQDTIVEPSHSTHAYGKPDINVLATPALIGLIERACFSLMERDINPTDTTVGIYISMEHLAPTGMGATVSVHTTVESISRNKISFNVQVTENDHVIASARHRRALVNRSKLTATLNASN